MTAHGGQRGGKGIRGFPTGKGRQNLRERSDILSGKSKPKAAKWKILRGDLWEDRGHNQKRDVSTHG